MFWNKELDKDMKTWQRQGKFIRGESTSKRRCSGLMLENGDLNDSLAYHTLFLGMLGLATSNPCGGSSDPVSFCHWFLSYANPNSTIPNSLPSYSLASQAYE